MLAAQLLSVALTWGAGGRFMIPVHPFLVALVCAMLVRIVLGAGRASGKRFEGQAHAA